MTSPAPIAWMVPAGTKMLSPCETACHTTRFVIDPSSPAWRSCCEVRRRFRPKATVASAVAKYLQPRYQVARTGFRLSHCRQGVRCSTDVDLRYPTALVRYERAHVQSPKP